MPTKVILMRHGQTSWNVLGRWQGHAPIPLDEEGCRQAQIAANYLKDFPISHIYSSDLKRAHQTAEFIASLLETRMTFDPRLRECDLGNWQGLHKDEIQLWDAEQYEARNLDTFYVPCPGGESWQEVGRRAFQAITEYAQRHFNGVVLCITHGGTIWSILRATRVLLPSSAPLPNTSLTELEYETGQWALLSIGKTPHLNVQF